MWENLERLIFGSILVGVGTVFNVQKRNRKKNKKNILITGANRGIGLALVKHLSKFDDIFIYAGSRNLERGEDAIQSIENKEHIKIIELDVTNPGKVAEKLPAKLFAIVHNAGTGFGVSMEEVFAVNCFGPKNLDELLLERVQDEGKIIYVTSAAGPKFVSQCNEKTKSVLLNPKNWSDLQNLIDSTKNSTSHFFENKKTVFSPYHLSKAILNAYMILTSKKCLRVQVNACVPGYIETDLMRRYAAIRGKDVAKMGMKKPKDGIFSILKLLFDIESTGGHYGSDGLTRPMDFEVY